MGFYDFGNNRNDGYTTKPYEYTPAWEKDVERNPDKLRSSAGMWIEDHNGDLIWVLQVKGVHGEKMGAIVLRASSSYKNSDGKLEFMGMSEFTAAEIHTGTIDESDLGRTHDSNTGAMRRMGAYARNERHNGRVEEGDAPLRQ